MRQFLALAAAFERGAHGGTGLIQQRAERRGFYLIDIVA